MLTFKCKMCGGDIYAEQGSTHGSCDSCGTTSTLPRASDERLVNLFNRANHQRQQNEFDKALANYENILNEDSSNAEAHWGVVLCRYGIEYVEDPRTRERVPTCHRVQYEAILSDGDYHATLQNAPDSYARELYETEAKKISEIQKGILAISNQEKPYDVFICYKETTDGGSRTKDSTLAQDIYYHLEKEDYKVFFSRITLEGKLGQQYEPYIFSALNSAKVMLVIGTKPEYFNAVWVRNEWSRFLTLVKKDRNKLLIPCYRDMDAYDLPDELSIYQSQDMSKLGFMQDLIRGVKKILDVNKKPESVKPTVVGGVSVAGTESLLRRAFLFLEDGDFKQGNEYFDRVLDIDPENARAYIGKLLAELNLRSEAAFQIYDYSISNNPNYKKAFRFSDSDYKLTVSDYAEMTQKNEQQRLETIRKEKLLKEAREKTSDVFGYVEAERILKQIKGFKDADSLLQKMNDDINTFARHELNNGNIEDKYNAAKILESVGTIGGADRFAMQLRTQVGEYIDEKIRKVKELQKINTFDSIQQAIALISPYTDIDAKATTAYKSAIEQSRIERKQRTEREKAREKKKQFILGGSLLFIFIIIILIAILS